MATRCETGSVFRFTVMLQKPPSNVAGGDSNDGIFAGIVIGGPSEKLDSREFARAIRPIRLVSERSTI